MKRKQGKQGDDHKKEDLKISSNLKDPLITWDLTHNDVKYKFLFFQQEDPLFEKTRDFLISVSHPELLERKNYPIKICTFNDRSQCYIGNLFRIKDLTFYLKQDTTDPLDPSFHQCVSEQLRKCKNPKRTSISLDTWWKPPQPYPSFLVSSSPRSSLSSSSSSSNWIAYLITLNTEKKNLQIVAATSQGDSKHIDMVEIHPRFRGKSLCAVFMDSIMRALLLNAWTDFELTNAAGEIGDKCYRKAAKQAGLQATCLDRTEKYCDEFRFTLTS